MCKKKHKLRSCAPIYTQHATKKPSNATSSATDPATIDLKALALKGLKRNKERNRTATNEKKQRNSGAPKVTKKLRKENCEKCSHREELPQHGPGCVLKTNGKYQYQWNLLDILKRCPLGHWN